MKTFLLFTICIITSFNSGDIKYGRKVVTIHASADTNKLMTEEIQDAIDLCTEKGGGVVILKRGEYLSGTILLKDNVELKLKRGVTLKGSSDYSDYRNDAFIYGRDLKGIRITGKGTIDGADCYNPKGEEGFRGPHCIRLVNCRDIGIVGILIIRSANWAINCRYCTRGRVKDVKIRGGHDGLHTRFCSDFTVAGCDFRTGDDTFAGNDNRNFIIKNCKVNTSCNGFRFGCDSLLIENCSIWGPGEYVHKIQKRNNTLSAFVHFSPADQKPEIKSGNWLVRNTEVRNVDSFYNYNFENGLWQTGQPVGSIRFENIRATGLLRAFYINGDKGRQFDLSIRNSRFSFRENSGVTPDVFEGVSAESDAFFFASDFGKLDMENVWIKKSGSDVIMQCKSGDYLKHGLIDFRSWVRTGRFIFDNIEVLTSGR